MHVLCSYVKSNEEPHRARTLINKQNKRQYFRQGFIFLTQLFLIRNACENIWGGELKDLVEDRGKRGLYAIVYDNILVVNKVCQTLRQRDLLIKT